MMGAERDTFQRVVQGVREWIPSKAHGHEREFQKELQTHLDDHLNGQQQGIDLGLGGTTEHVVSRERGKSRADVCVDDVVGIEIKRNLSNSQTKKLRGQIEDYTDNYPYVIVCACGISDMDGWRELKNKYEGPQGIGFEGSEIAFVHKKKTNYGSDPGTGGSGPGWGGFGLLD